MRIKSKVAALTAVLVLVGASPVMAVPSGEVSVEPVVEFLTLDGTPVNNHLGSSVLVRRDDSLWAKVTVDGLRPGASTPFGG